MTAVEGFDLIVIGAGPAGQKAAIQGAKSGCRVLLVERGHSVGGECLHRGTIPSKTLRETAVYLSGFRQRSEGILNIELPPDLKVASLMQRQGAVLGAHERFIAAQLERNRVSLWRGRASFVSTHRIEVTAVDGSKRQAEGQHFVIAAGSRPRTPPEIPVDHEHILDSDSILSLIYLPGTMTVLGAGVIACEFATIFASLGVEVTIVDRGERPMPFLDHELTEHFLADFQRHGGRYLPGRQTATVEYDGLGTVVTTLKDGEVLRSEKLLCALGRTAQVADLGLDRLGIKLSKYGFIEVNACLQTAQPHIYAAGDIIGPPALAATSVEQGRRAVRHALGLETDELPEMTPVGIYTVPEMSGVGLTEEEAARRYGEVVIGRARFNELARGQICGAVEGLLKLIVEPEENRLVGAHIVGEGATELIHVGQLAVQIGWTIDRFIDNVFNFPTMAEAYRVAALDAAGKLASKSGETELRDAA